MKTIQKMGALLLVLVMTFAFGLTTLAEDKGSITITNPQEGKTYTAYKIFDVTYAGDSYSYTIQTDAAVYAKVAEYAALASNGLILTANEAGTECVVTVDARFSAASFAKFLRENNTALGQGTPFTADGQTMKAANLELGYYFVDGTSGTVCELVTAKDVSIKDKNETPDIDKDVDNADNTVEVGQMLTYTITGKVPSTKGYKANTYKYIVTDTMTEGLTYQEDVTVTIGGTEAVAGVTKTTKGNGFEVVINMDDYQNSVDAPVVITYTAVVNEKAIQRDKETNTAVLEYSNDPAVETTGRFETTVDVYSFNIVIDKYKTGEETTKLEGAKFVLKNADGSKYYKYDAVNKKVEWVTEKAQATEVVTDAQGRASFEGLQAGTYRLEETMAPGGYNPLAGDVIIVINKEGTATVAGAASNPAEANLSLTAKVANATGTVLPETGGVGTMIFIVVGTIAVIGAGLFLVTNKRMSKESF